MINWLFRFLRSTDSDRKIDGLIVPPRAIYHGHDEDMARRAASRRFTADSLKREAAKHQTTPERFLDRFRPKGRAS
jgi:hypothetical protein